MLPKLSTLIARSALAAVAASLVVSSAIAATAQYVLVIRDHRFEPASIEVPAGQAITLVVKNTDATPEEFESHELDREKVILGGQQAVIRLGPLSPGIYPFVGEFHEDTAKGTIVVK